MPAYNRIQMGFALILNFLVGLRQTNVLYILPNLNINVFIFALFSCYNFLKQNFLLLFQYDRL